MSSSVTSSIDMPGQSLIAIPLSDATTTATPESIQIRFRIGTADNRIFRGKFIAVNAIEGSYVQDGAPGTFRMVRTGPPVIRKISPSPAVTAERRVGNAAIASIFAAISPSR